MKEQNLHTANCIISVIIPTLGDIDRLFKALVSLRGQQVQLGYEVLIMLNGDVKIDELIERLSERGLDLRNHEKILRSDPIGSNRARNYGAENAAGKFLYFLDDDCRLMGQGHLNNLVQYLEEHSQIAGVGGPYELDAGANSVDRAYHRLAAAWVESAIYAAPRTLFLLGGNFAIRRSAFSDKCRFDDSVVWGGAELSYFVRALQEKRIFHWNEELAVEHQLGLTVGKYVKKLRAQNKSTQNYLRAGLLLRYDAFERPLPSNWREAFYFFLADWVNVYSHSMAYVFALLIFPLRLVPYNLLRHWQKKLIGARIYLTSNERK